MGIDAQLAYLPLLVQDPVRGKAPPLCKACLLSQFTQCSESLVDTPKGLSPLSSGQYLLTATEVNSHDTQTERT